MILWLVPTHLMCVCLCACMYACMPGCVWVHARVCVCVCEMQVHLPSCMQETDHLHILHNFGSICRTPQLYISIDQVCNRTEFLSLNDKQLRLRELTLTSSLASVGLVFFTALSDYGLLVLCRRPGALPLWLQAWIDCGFTDPSKHHLNWN